LPASKALTVYMLRHVHSGSR